MNESRFSYTTSIGLVASLEGEIHFKDYLGIYLVFIYH